MTSDQIQTIKSLLGRFGCKDYAAILKWDESKVHRNPKGKGGGRFARGGTGGGSLGEGGASALGMTALGLKEPRGSQLPRNSVAAYQRQVLDRAIADEVTRIQEEAAQFHGTPRLDENLTLPAPERTITEALATGTASAVVKKLGGSANSCYIIEMEDGTKGFYKPQNGETWEASFNNYDISNYVTNKDFSLAEREAFASEASVALGLETLVPETHHRTQLDVPGIDSASAGGGSSSSASGGGYDEDYVRELYDEYEEKARESVMDNNDVGDKMYEMYQRDQEEHVEDIKRRAEEVAEIWNEEVENFPDDDRYGSQTFQREHPVLPLGSEAPFERRERGGIVDPLEVLNEADVNKDGSLTDEEKDKVREVLRAKLEEGSDELGDVDEEAAKEDLDYDSWREDHEYDEDQLLQSELRNRVQSFDEWRHANGHYSNSSGGGWSGGGSSSGGGSGDNPGPGGALMEYLGQHPDETLKHEDATKIAVLDYVIGSMDRHGRNVIYDEDGKPRAIDNGYSMPGGMSGDDNFTFRSFAVDRFINSSRADNVPESLRSSIGSAIEATDWQALVDRHPNMSSDEREAFLGRVGKMKEALKTPEGLKELWGGLSLMGY